MLNTVLMDNLDKELRRLSKIDPSKGFIKESKQRLMQQIQFHQHETWFKAFLRHIGLPTPSPEFLSQARIRLMDRITRVPLQGFAGTFLVLKRAVASSLVMMIAVTATLFFVEGNTVVEASDDSYLEVYSGSASIKHADLIVWEDINSVIEVQAGDIIKVEEDSEVVVHFFDDSELRLGENSMFLISQLTVSPSFSRQAIIEIALHEGQAWVQTLNVDDGFANFTLTTRNAIFSTLNGTFSTSAGPDQPTIAHAINNKVQLTTVEVETRQPVANAKLAPDDKVTIHTSTSGQPVFTTSQFTEQDLASPWFQANMERDQAHLTALRENGINRLTLTAGTLPGEMLYPIKQAKERLKLALTSDADLAVKIDIANRRLSEAIVLLEAGDKQNGREALLAYQSMARQIAEAKGDQDVTTQLLVPHQKTLSAELPNDAAVSLVKDTLHQAAEILANSPVELERVRLQNSVDRLQDLVALVEAGDLEAAKERLVSHQLVGSDVLGAVDELVDEDVKKIILQEVVDLRQEEFSLITTVSEALLAQKADDEMLTAMLESAAQAAEENVELALAAAIPLIPELALAQEPALSGIELKIAEIVEKIYIYNTFDGQQNQIERLLKYELQNVSSIEFLIMLRNELTGRAYDYLNVKILQLQQKEEYIKAKAVQRKIERTQRLREDSGSELL